MSIPRKPDEDQRRVGSGLPTPIDWKAPVPELEGSFPVVLYFPTAKDRDYFIEIVKAAMPTLTSTKL